MPGSTLAPGSRWMATAAERYGARIPSETAQARPGRTLVSEGRRQNRPFGTTPPSRDRRGNGAAVRGSAAPGKARDDRPRRPLRYPEQASVAVVELFMTGLEDAAGAADERLLGGRRRIRSDRVRHLAGVAFLKVHGQRLARRIRDAHYRGVGRYGVVSRGNACEPRLRPGVRTSDRREGGL
jgi:hypothetical protein